MGMLNRLYPNCQPALTNNERFSCAGICRGAWVIAPTNDNVGMSIEFVSHGYDREVHAGNVDSRSADAERSFDEGNVFRTLVDGFDGSSDH